MKKLITITVLLSSTIVMLYAGKQGATADGVPTRCVVPGVCLVLICWGPAIMPTLGSSPGDFQTAAKCGFCLLTPWVECGPPEIVTMEEPE